LGLGIIKNIIEAHHGSIHIAAISPNGTRVEITLPSRKAGLKELS